MKGDDYLWDRSGEPDPEIERLEQVLAPLRHDGRPLVSAAAARPLVVGGRRWTGPAALLLLAATVVFLVQAAWPRNDEAPLSWTVEAIDGRLAPGAAPASGAVGLHPNRWIETGPASRIRVSADDVGTVEIDGGSRIRLVSSRGGEHRLALERGTLHARIWAAPGQFFVETPAATAIDLGCAYTLIVDEAGVTRLRVTAGWVGLAGSGRESFVPAGATCETRRGDAPGIPRFDDAPPVFIEALSRVGSAAPEERSRALDVVLATARTRDAFSLWHLLARVDHSSAALVVERLAALAPLPAGVTRERVLAGDPVALDAWWDGLGLGDATWFRRYRATHAR
jgi:hypothetical protein